MPFGIVYVWNVIWSLIPVIVSPSLLFIAAISCSVVCELNVCICVAVWFTWPGQLSLYWFSFSNGVVRLLAQVYAFSFQFTVPVYSCNHYIIVMWYLDSFVFIFAFGEFNMLLNHSAFSDYFYYGMLILLLLQSDFFVHGSPICITHQLVALIVLSFIPPSDFLVSFARHYACVAIFNW